MWDVLQAILVGWPCCGMNQLATTKTLVRLVGERIAQTTPYTKMFREAEGGGSLVEEMSDFNIFLIKGIDHLGYTFMMSNVPHPPDRKQRPCGKMARLTSSLKACYFVGSWVSLGG